MKYPPAYHITFGTYGTRLHGSNRPFVDKEHNEFGTPFPETDPEREAHAREWMAHPPVYLTVEQRHRIENAIIDFAKRFEWTVHAIAVQTDHVHIVITAEREGDPLREAIKAAASRALNPVYGKQRWWAEGGSDKYLFEPDYFANAVDYVKRQRDW